ncbi:RDD family protein [Pengzhenrongella sp.]|jgi:uncharacterized RDD family membrane protein YckC|uniref:RDD family protein n=1 Tax=Pengzhenrongella sp. TaxID=2888820 RepID=UPI002F940EDA
MTTDSEPLSVQPYGPPKTFTPQELPPELALEDPYRQGAQFQPATHGAVPTRGQAPPYLQAGAYSAASSTPQYSLPGYPPPTSVQGGYPGGQYGGFPPALAPWGVRVGALIIDRLANAGGYLLCVVIALVTATRGVDPNGHLAFHLTPVGNLVRFFGLLVWLAMWIWNRGVRQGGSGQSLGKRATKLRLVSAATGQPIGVRMALFRDVAHVLDMVLYVGFLWPLWDTQRQTFADKICSTLVVRD